MRLQVYLSHSGSCSRRRALDYIKAGRVSVNGDKVTEPSFQTCPSDSVLLDGREVALKKKTYILLNKPKGVVTTTRDRHAAKLITECLPPGFRHLMPVGRLDSQTSGLIILTNDGQLSFRLAHPSFETQKVYSVFSDKPLSLKDKARLEQGVYLDGKKTYPCKINVISAQKAEIVIHEGRKRQVRRMFEALGYHVVELCRIRQGSIALGDLKEGEWRFLKKEEIDRLYAELKMK